VQDRHPKLLCVLHQRHNPGMPVCVCVCVRACVRACVCVCVFDFLAYLIIEAVTSVRESELKNVNVTY
jgi:hypothetical protein